MKFYKTLLLAALLLLGGFGNAWADHRSHAHIGVYFGAPWGPWYYPPPYYYYPPRVVVVPPAPPPVYVEQATAPPSSQAPGNYWYYCDGAKAYYPYVKDCPGGWQAVAPAPTR